MLSGVVFSVAWLRTHGLWLAWGMHFAWNASMGVLFGLPVAGSVDYSTLIQTSTFGSTAGLPAETTAPKAQPSPLIALIAGLIVLVRTTRDYAWNYTHAPIVAGGYPMDVAPPAAHTAMEQAQQTRAPELGPDPSHHTAEPFRRHRTEALISAFVAHL